MRRTGRSAATTVCASPGRWPGGEGEEVRVFLIGDAASCAKGGQKVPPGYYNIEVMLRGVVRHGGSVGVCGTCMDARGIGDAELAEGCARSTLEELTNWTQQADRVLVF